MTDDAQDGRVQTSEKGLVGSRHSQGGGRPKLISTSFVRVANDPLGGRPALRQKASSILLLITNQGCIGSQPGRGAEVNRWRIAHQTTPFDIGPKLE